MTPPSDWIRPDWNAPRAVRAYITTRQGGSSIGPYASMNLGYHVGDDIRAVDENHARLREYLPAGPCWMKQVHGPAVIETDQWRENIEADASLTRNPDVVCAVMVADCMPVLFCDDQASVVAVAHAGWRGLCNGVLENTLDAMQVDPARLRVYLGPAIGPDAFEVGDDVYEAFKRSQPDAASAFRARATGKWTCDLFTLARQRLRARGVVHIHGGTDCTFSDSHRFFSHRRDRVSGRMAALIWLAGAPH